MSARAETLPFFQGERASRLLEEVEKRASQTSFEDLDRFGAEAETLRTTEGLRRLQHVVGVYINQNEGTKALQWNERLKARAAALNNERFRSVAKLNAAIVAHEGGDERAVDTISRIMDDTSDWYVRVTATRYYALIRFDLHHIGEGLRLLATVQAQIPEGDPSTAAAHSGIWEVMGIGLMALSDVRGASDAFIRYELDNGENDWPRPDFDSIYNLGSMALEVGDVATAERFYAAHDRLTRKSNLPGLIGYNAMMCARLASLNEDMPRVLQCLQAGGQDLSQDKLLGIWLLPLEITALARTGRIAEAEKVMARWRVVAEGYQTGTRVSDQGLKAQAEIFLAKGQTAQAVALMRRYHQLDSWRQARNYSDGVHQITQDMQAQLSERRLQLATEQANTRLQGAVIEGQKWLVLISLIGVLAIALAWIWLWRQASELKRARERAEDANNAKSVFLANMSHEIRTPLNGVLAMSDALYRSDLSKEDQEMVRIIRSSASTLATLLNDILDTARIESGEFDLDPSPMNLAGILREAHSLWNVQAQSKGVELRLEGVSSVDRIVLGDPVRLRQVINNLVSNALKFTERGSVTIRAEAVEGDRIRVSVVDTGVGFGDDFRDRIFSRFQQADGSITRRFGGSGLGLNISNQLVRMMGGKMDCVSAPGVGSTFWFEVALPPSDLKITPVETVSRGLVASPSSSVVEPVEVPSAKLAVLPLPDTVTEQASGKEREEGEGRLRILLADDHAANRKVVEILLSSINAELVAVCNGREAVEAYEGGNFDLILMDMQMPEMDGLSATRAIRAMEERDARRRTPIIMLTANAMTEHVAAGRKAGADHHLCKPVTMDGLLQMILAATATRKIRLDKAE